MTTINKTSRARTNLVVLYSQNYAARTRGHYHESSDCFEYPKKSLLRSSSPKNYLPNVPTQKNPGMENFRPQKILRSSPSCEIRSTPPGQRNMPSSQLAHLVLHTTPTDTTKLEQHLHCFQCYVSCASTTTGAIFSVQF